MFGKTYRFSTFYFCPESLVGKTYFCFIVASDHLGCELIFVTLMQVCEYVIHVLMCFSYVW